LFWDPINCFRGRGVFMMSFKFPSNFLLGHSLMVCDIDCIWSRHQSGCKYVTTIPCLITLFHEIGRHILCTVPAIISLYHCRIVNRTPRSEQCYENTNSNVINLSFFKHIFIKCIKIWKMPWYGIYSMYIPYHAILLQ